jgi:hypothetical protein
MSTCPELSAHVDDAQKALAAYLRHRAWGLEGVAKFDLMLLTDALEQALKQARIETSALHDFAGGPW